MKIRVLVGFGGYEAGQVFPDWPAGMCEILIAKQVIEEVKGETEATEKPAVSPKRK